MYVGKSLKKNSFNFFILPVIIPILAGPDSHESFAIKGQSRFFLMYVFKSSRYDVWRQYFVYDFNSFFAEVGGFLGLFLGHSLYSLYNKAAALLHSQFKI